MPCSISNEIVRSITSPSFHPTVGSDFQSDAYFQGHLQQTVVVQPYVLTFGPIRDNILKNIVIMNLGVQLEVQMKP